MKNVKAMGTLKKIYVLEWDGKRFFFSYETDRNREIMLIHNKVNTIKTYEIDTDFLNEMLNLNMNVTER